MPQDDQPSSYHPRTSDDGLMPGYGAHSYGESFADVYDDWYASVTDVGATVALVSDLASRGRAPGMRVLELGVGTGRLALPMAAAGLRVTGVDASPAMMARLEVADPEGKVTAVLGDMVADLPAGPFDVAVAAYNTIFNLVDESSQRACFERVARSLAPHGCFVVEAFVPDEDVGVGSAVTVRSMGVDHVVLSVSEHRHAGQRALGQFVEITATGGVRLRPWSIRWATPAQLDAMAASAGFVVESRWGDMSCSEFDDDSTHHVTVYRLP